MNEDCVTYKQAVKLKELGFNWTCNHYYDAEIMNVDDYLSPDVADYYDNHNAYQSRISAPTLAQAQKWLREKEIEVGVFAEFDGELRTGQWVWLMRKFNTHLYDTVFSEDNNYDTYEQALSAGIDEALELLKEKNDTKG